jgi:GTP pyrophosphokinase
MPLFWEGEQRGHVTVCVQVIARDRHNLLSDISQMISSTGTNIVGSQTETINHIATLDFTLEVNSTNHLNTVMQQLLGIEGVKNVRRMRIRGRNQSNFNHEKKKNGSRTNGSVPKKTKAKKTN